MPRPLAPGATVSVNTLVTTGVELTADGGFVWKAKPSDLRAGIGPQSVIAYDENGAELGRESIAISG